MSEERREVSLPRIIQTGGGWGVRIDGTDALEGLNRDGCYTYRAFDIASRLASKEEAEQALAKWVAQVKVPRGEPVTLPAAMHPHDFDNLSETHCNGYNACLDEIAKLGPLYPLPSIIYRWQKVPNAEWSYGFNLPEGFEGHWTALSQDDTVREMMILSDRVDKFKSAFCEFIDKTDWVQADVKPQELGLHRADVLRQRLEQSKADLDALQARVARMAKQHDQMAAREETLRSALTRAIGLAENLRCSLLNATDDFEGEEAVSDEENQEWEDLLEELRVISKPNTEEEH